MARDGLLDAALVGSGLLSGVILLLVVLFLAIEAAPALVDPGPVALLTDPAWYPTEGRWGLLSMVLGSGLVAAGGLALAVPAGISTALFATAVLPPRLGAAWRWLLGILAGVPSVVYGLWGLLVLVPWIAAYEPPGASLLAGALILGLMILPTVGLTAADALAQARREHGAAAAALGLSPWGAALGVFLPAGRGGVATGTLLATGRALGETMAVLMVCGNVAQVPDSVFAPVRTLTANIALEMGYALDAHRTALFASGLALLAVVAGIVAIAHRMEAP